MTAAYSLLADPFLPQLQQALDPTLMARQFAAHLSAPDGPDSPAFRSYFEVRGCRIGRVKYKRGFRCTVAYTVSIADRRTGEIHEQLFSGRLYAPGESQAHFERAIRAPLVQPAFGPAVFRMDALDMVVWSFPNDRKLVGLASITSPEVLHDDLLPPVVRQHWGPAWSIDALAHSIVSYVPEGRCCVRVALQLRDSRNDQTRQWTLFGKAHCNDRGERSYESLRRLWDCTPSVGIPRPLAYRADYRLFWQEAVAGQPLAQRPMNLAAVRMAADAVAKLHRIPCQGAYRITMADVADALQQTESQLGHALPSGHEQLSATVQRMIQQVDELDSTVAATIHRDLHPHNILIDRDRANLIDLDDVCIGPPLHDIGSFVARVLYQALLDGSTDEGTRRIIDGFVEHYRTRVPWPVERREVAWYTAVALINERVLRRVTHLDADQPAILQQTLDLADQLIRGEADALEIRTHA